MRSVVLIRENGEENKEFGTIATSDETYWLGSALLTTEVRTTVFMFLGKK